MRYSAPNYALPALPAPSGGVIGVVIFSIVLVVVLISIVILGVALGVGLGVGLTRNSGSSSSNSGTSSNNNSNASSFSSVANCNYNESVCGCAETKPTNLAVKIINGYNATAHSWPWIVALSRDGVFFCGGVLAESYDYVITAAHCYNNSTDNSTIEVFAGLQTLSPMAIAQSRTVVNWVIHPNYTRTATYIYNDIAVIKLQSSFNKTNDVGLCCLPPGNASLPFLGEFAVIAGWGQTQENAPTSLSETLMQAVVQIQGPSSFCDASARPEVQFCAGYGTSDTCQGDSGGPLMTVVNNSWTCTGIVSTGTGCGHSGYYTRVSNFRSFIDQTIGPFRI